MTRLADYRFCPQCGSALGMRDEGGLARPACAAADCDFVLWENPVPVVAALVEYEGQIVLARNVAWPEKQFGLITGYLEREETPDAAVAREVAEELGLSAQSVSLIGLYNFAPKNQLIIAYHVLASGQIVLNEKLAEFKLIEPSKLKAWEFGTGPAVRDWLASQSA
ncbi:MAG: NUDIX domain-containing protein [Azonexus sp.]|nr:NUDIX domain-containing protein [Azonexus sp.]